MSVVIRDNGIAGGQPQAAALLLGGKIRLEDPLEMLPADTHPLVHDRNLDVSPLFQKRIPTRPCLHVLHLDVEDAPLGHGLIRVDDQVLDHLADLAGIHLDRPQPPGQGEITADVGPPQNKGGRMLDNLGDGGCLFDGRSSLGKGQQLLGQLRSPTGRAFHFGHNLV